MDSLRFTIPEILSLIGVVQCVYILVYMAFRSGRISRAGLPMAYFLALGVAFLIDFAAQAAPELTPYYFYLQWLFWFLGPPLSVLLILQVAQLSEVPPLRYFSVLLLMPVAAAMSLALTSISNAPEGCGFFDPCAALNQWLTLTGIIAGVMSMIAIWLKWDVIAAMNITTGSGARAAFKSSRERYWLILAILIANISFLALMLGSLYPAFDMQSALVVRTLLGLAFVYLVNTSLFRIYPQAVRLYAYGNSANKVNDLTPDEQILAKKIEELMFMQKVYQEANYARSDLARECGANENVVSKVINIHFGKTFPQLINEARIEDAKRLLQETDAAIKVVAEQVGFNSLPTFNRVFREVTGVPPSHFRRVG